MASRIIKIETDGLTLSGLIWAVYRSTSAGIVENVYSINPDLGRKGLILPVGTRVKLPDGPPPAMETREIVKLWD